MGIFSFAKGRKMNADDMAALGNVGVMSEETISEKQKFSQKNNVEYLKKIMLKKTFCGLKGFNRFIAFKNAYIYMTPPNVGIHVGEISWHFEKQKYDEIFLLDNQRAFREITNLTDLLIQLVQVYIDNIDGEYYVSPNYVGLRLTDELKLDYEGEAELVFSDVCIKNVSEKYPVENKIEKYNQFLDCFLGWNFGYNIQKSPELKALCEELLQLMKDRNMRKRITSGFDVWSSNYVLHYDFL